MLNVIYPELWDPHMAGTLGPLAALSPLYNQVVEFNPHNPSEIIGDLATRWEVTEDGLTYTFYLHDHVKWWDGKDLTAEDVVFSLKRMIEPGKPRPRVGLLRPYIKTVDLIDRLTVKVTLNFPAPAFLPLLAVDFMKIVPKHVVEAGVDINVWGENIVGSGPFKFKSARRGDSVHHEKNLYFKKGRPYLDALSIVIINDKGTAAAAIKAGRIQITTAITGLEVDDVLKLEKELKGNTACTGSRPATSSISSATSSASPGKTCASSRPYGWLRTVTSCKRCSAQATISMGAPFPPTPGGRTVRRI